MSGFRMIVRTDDKPYVVKIIRRNGAVAFISPPYRNAKAAESAAKRDSKRLNMPLEIQP